MPCPSLCTQIFNPIFPPLIFCEQSILKVASVGDVEISDASSSSSDSENGQGTSDIVPRAIIRQKEQRAKERKQEKDLWDREFANNHKPANATRRRSRVNIRKKKLKAVEMTVPSSQGNVPYIKSLIHHPN